MSYGMGGKVVRGVGDVIEAMEWVEEEKFEEEL